MEGLYAPQDLNYLRVRAQGLLSAQRDAESATAGATSGAACTEVYPGCTGWYIPRVYREVHTRVVYRGVSSSHTRVVYRSILLPYPGICRVYTSHTRVYAGCIPLIPQGVPGCTGLYLRVYRGVLGYTLGLREGNEAQSAVLSPCSELGMRRRMLSFLPFLS